MKTILCPVDFSNHSRRAFDYASDLAERAGAKLLILHVEEPPAPMTVAAGAEVGLAPSTIAVPSGGDLAPPGEQDTPHSPPASEALQQFAPKADVNYEQRVRQGAPADEIVGLAKEESIDQIVIGTHGRTGWRRVLLGSTAEQVVQRADCPVTVVKGADSEPQP